MEKANNSRPGLEWNDLINDKDTIFEAVIAQEFHIQVYQGVKVVILGQSGGKITGF